MPQAEIHTDPSCYHGSFSVLLRNQDPEADLPLLLGGNAATVATFANGFLFFEEPLPGLADSLGRRGWKVSHEDVAPEDPWHGVLDVLAQGGQVAMAFDTYYLEHFWDLYQRVHLGHVVALLDLDTSDRTIRLVDSVDLSFFDGRVPLRSIEPALSQSELEQFWMKVEPSGGSAAPPSASELRGELRGYAEQFSGSPQRWLSGSRMFSVLRETMDEHLALFQGRVALSSTPGEEPNAGTVGCIKNGIWFYHNNLRWFAKFLTRLRETEGLPVDDKFVEQIVRVSRDCLVMRNLMVRIRDDRDDAQRRRLDDCLGRLIDSVDVTGAYLHELAETVV